MTYVFQPRVLGASDLTVPALGIGTNEWGDSRGKSDEDVFQTFKTYMDTGMAFFDTAEVYKRGNSERVLGRFLRRDRRPAIIASKFAPLPTRLSPHALMDALDASLQRLGVESIDLYHIHWPYTLLRIDALMDMMALAVRIGKIRAVGVSNYSAKQMRQAVARLAHYGIPLASNEVHYSLFHRQPEINGVLDTCRELNVALIAYQPLERGVLLRPTAASESMPKSSKTSLFERVSATRKATPEDRMKLQETLQTISQKRGRTISQIVLNWLLQQDERIIAIPGTTNAQHVAENLAALTWQLDAEDLADIEQASRPWKV